MSDLIITNGDEKLYVFDYVEGGSNLPVYESCGARRRAHVSEFFQLRKLRRGND